MRRRFALLILPLVLAAIFAHPAQYADAQQPAPCAVAAAAALSMRGHQYVWGSKGPNTFDCSGLTYWAWSQAGYNIGLSTSDQAHAGMPISCRLSDIHGTSTTCWQAGDLIFLRYSGGQHVAMYIGDGLFADAYNTSTGVIIHNPANDNFYWSHFWQARRIVSCDGVTVTPGTSSGVSGQTPALESIPDILAPVSFSVPQCNDCNPDGSVYLPSTPWDGKWPSGMDALNLLLVMQTVISWLVWQMGELLRQLLCWLLSMLATLAAMLAMLANVVVSGINALWKILVFLWLSLQEWFLALWYLIDDTFSLINAALSGLAAYLAIFGVLISIFIELIGGVLQLLGLLIGSVLGLLAWIGGLTIGMFQLIIAALRGTAVPIELQDTSIVYLVVRGGLEAWRDSPYTGWMIYLFWALCYLGFFLWISRFMSSSQVD